MYWEKEIRFKLTSRRIFSGILTVMSVMNLIIVGVVFTAPTSSPPAAATSTLTTAPSLVTLQTSSREATTAIFTATLAFTNTFTLTPTSTSTPTETATPTATSTSPPTPTLCVSKSYWPFYYVQRGDTLYELAHATDSTVDDLRLANCLPDTHIFAGQLLYVPRLPIQKPLATPTHTDTPTTVPTNPPTVFQNPSGDILLCNNPYYINFSVLPIDPEGISSVSAYYLINKDIWNQNPMHPDGTTYFGSGTISDQYSQIDTAYYYFSAVDGFGNITNSDVYGVKLTSCPKG